MHFLVFGIVLLELLLATLLRVEDVPTYKVEFLPLDLSNWILSLEFLCSLLIGLFCLETEELCVELLDV